MNKLLAKYNKSPIPWSVRPKLMGVPSIVADDELYAWANLQISREEFQAESLLQRSTHYPDCELLPGAEKLLLGLLKARGQDGKNIEIAMASSSTRPLYSSRFHDLKLVTFSQGFSMMIIGYWEIVLD